MKQLATFWLIICFMTSNSCTNSEASIPYKPIASLPSRSYSLTIKPYLHRLIMVLSENTAYYDWLDGCRCNVGLLAQIVTKESYEELKIRKHNEYSDFWNWADRGDGRNAENPHSWKSLINFYCGTEQRTTSGIVGDMINVGFTKEDLIHLEFLSDSYILSKINKRLDYRNQDDLILYLKTWEGLI
jgi:hypothetical protein